MELNPDINSPRCFNCF